MKKLSEFFVRYDLPFEYFQAFNYLISIFICCKFWLFPDLSNAHFLTNSIHLFVTEFLLVHSGVFMAVFARSKKIIVVIIIYGFLIFDLAKSFGDNYFFYLYLLIVLLRMRSAFSGFNPLIFFKNIMMSVAGILFFMIAGISMAILENYIPVLGLREDYLNNSGFRWENKDSGGMIVDKPYLIMYFWIVYFTLWFFLEIYLIRLKKEFFNSKGTTITTFSFSKK